MIAAAYDDACKNYDFEKVAGRLGMLMTVDDESDAGIHLQGLGSVTFTDADGGEDGMSSVDDDDYDNEEEEFEDEELAAAADEADGDDLEFDVGLSDDEDDDTDLQGVIGEAVAPAGFKFSDQDLTHVNDVIGKDVLVKLASAPLREHEYEWYRGTVQSRNPQTQDYLYPNISSPVFHVSFHHDRMNATVIQRYKTDVKKGAEKKHALVPFSLAPDTRRTTWYLLAKT